MATWQNRQTDDPGRTTGPPRPRRCPNCHQPTLTGLLNGNQPPVVTVDPPQLTIKGELHALAAGRTTYGMSPGFPLTRRDVWTISNVHPAPGFYAVHVDHECGNPHSFPHYPEKAKPVKVDYERPPY